MYPWNAECDSRNTSKLARYGLQSAREERVSRVANDDPLPPGDEGDQARADRVGNSELVSRFKGVIVSYCKVSIDSSQLRCTVFSKYLG